MGVMRHLADFLRMLSVPCRVSYLPLLHEIIHSTNPFNWRLRLCLAVQVPDLLLLPPPELVFNTLYLLIITLLQDPVASVRRDSFTGVAKMMMVLSEHSDALSAFACIASMNLNTRSSVAVLNGNADAKHDARNIERSERWTAQHLAATAAHHVDTVARAINSLIQSKTYQLRQLWVELSHALLRELPQALFEKYFLDGLLYLTSDPVSNVRVAVGLVLAGWSHGEEPKLSDIVSKDPVSVGMKASPWVWLLRRPDVKECITRLSSDDKDVYLSIVKLQSVFPDIAGRIISCKGLKEAPGGSIPVPNAVTGIFVVESSSTSINEDKYSTMDSPYGSSDEPDESARRSRKKSVEVHQYIAETASNDTHFQAPVTLSISNSPSCEKERGGSYGVKSPGRGVGVLATAIAGLMQQQEEEIEQERLMHLKSAASEEGDDICLGSLDALMRVEGERTLPARPRGMSLPGEIIYDEMDEDDDEDSPPHTTSSSPFQSSSGRPVSPGVDAALKYAEQVDGDVPTLCCPSSASILLPDPTSLYSSFSCASSTDVELTDAEPDAQASTFDSD